jgi:hypothetical protein
LPNVCSAAAPLNLDLQQLVRQIPPGNALVALCPFRAFDAWDWERAWGWDFPVAAMCAARLGEGERAIDLLLMDVTKNRYLANGHNYQADRLPI